MSASMLDEFDEAEFQEWLFDHPERHYIDMGFARIIFMIEEMDDYLSSRPDRVWIVGDFNNDDPPNLVPMPESIEAMAEYRRKEN